VLPRDRQTEATIINVNLADRITSRRQGMLDMGKTYKEADDIIEQQDTEFQSDLDRAMKIARAQLKLQEEFAGQAVPNLQALMPGNGANGTAGKGTKPTQPTPGTGATSRAAQTLGNPRMQGQPNTRAGGPAN
jgi:hypothetical protein